MEGTPPLAESPLYAQVQGWIEEALAEQGYPRPQRKRLAALLTGLIAGEPATVSGVSATLHGLALSEAREPSIARRLLRTLAHPGLDPAQLLPCIFRQHLPAWLAEAAGTPGALPLRVVVDETTDQDAVHALVVGLVYQGLLLPLAVRVWPQNVRLGEGEYWSALGSLLWEVHGVLPAALRTQVVLLADRGFGYARMVDLAQSLRWDWVLRVSGQVRVRLWDGTELPLGDLVAQPGQCWGSDCALAEPLPEERADGSTVVAVFKQAGWRPAQVLGVWLADQADPWLLITNRPARPERLGEYAQRWAIERLFLSWKSHGWDLERGRVRDTPRLGRLLSALVLATWWRVAIALPAATAQLGHLAATAAQRLAPLPRGHRPVQLRLPFPPADPRPWAAKFSLLSWARKVLQGFPLRWHTPPLDWSFPDWDAPPWPQRCQALSHPAP
jgi:hypothetical protein